MISLTKNKAILNGDVILQILPALKNGGVERGTIEIAKAIVENNMKAIVVSAGGEMVQELEKIGATHITLNVDTKNPIKIIKNISKLVKVIKDFNVSLLHVRSRAPAWSSFFAAKKANIPMITTFHGIYGIKPKIKKIYNAVMLKGVKTIAISQFIKKHILQNYKIDENQIVVIPRGADVSRFNPDNVSNKEVEELRKLWEIPEKLPIILMPTRISPTKRIEVLINAVKDKNIFCAIVGSDHGQVEYKQSLLKFVKDLGVDDKIKFYPSMKNIEVAYALSDLVVTSLRLEAFGRTATEAQAMGKVPIAANDGGGAEIIQNKKNGFLVQENNVQSLSQSIDEYFSLSEKEKNQMKESAIQNVLKKYSISTMKDSTIRLYKEILHNK